MSSDASTPEAPAQVQTHSLLKNFISGGVGGMCLVFVGHPFDLIKVRLQTQAAGSQMYKGALDCARATVAKEGVRGLYKGLSAPLMGVTPIFAVCFWAYDAGKQLIRSMRGMHKDAELSLFDIGVAGAASAIPTTAIMAPGERIKCILQVQDAGGLAAGQQRYTGPGDVVKRLVRSEGITSLFRGSLATLLRDGSGSFAYFAVYEAYKRHFTQHGHAASASTVLIGGGLAGVFNWIVALPLDVVKSRIQIQTGAGASTSILAVARQLVKEEGVAGLYRGSAPALLRAFPANAACFMGMELSMAALNKLF